MNDPFPTYIFRQQNPYYINPGMNNLLDPQEIRSNISGRVNEYIAKALVYIHYIIRMLKSSAPFFEKYGPILQEVPKMYHLVKAFNEIREEGTTERSKEITEEESIVDPAPKLFI